MSKTKKTAAQGDYIALHELHLGDTGDGLGPSIIKAGSVVPEGTFDDETLERMVAKKAIQGPPAAKKSAKMEDVASNEDLDKITGTDGDDGLGDEGEGKAGDGEEGKAEAATSVPATKPATGAAVTKVAGNKKSGK